MRTSVYGTISGWQKCDWGPHQDLLDFVTPNSFQGDDHVLHLWRRDVDEENGFMNLFGRLQYQHQRWPHSIIGYLACDGSIFLAEEQDKYSMEPQITMRGFVNLEEKNIGGVIQLLPSPMSRITKAVAEKLGNDYETEISKPNKITYTVRVQPLDEYPVFRKYPRLLEFFQIGNIFVSMITSCATVLCFQDRVPRWNTIWLASVICIITPCYTSMFLDVIYFFFYNRI